MPRVIEYMAGNVNASQLFVIATLNRINQKLADEYIAGKQKSAVKILQKKTKAFLFWLSSMIGPADVCANNPIIPLVKSTIPIWLSENPWLKRTGAIKIPIYNITRNLS